MILVQKIHLITRKNIIQHKSNIPNSKNKISKTNSKRQFTVSEYQSVRNARKQNKKYSKERTRNKPQNSKLKSKDISVKTNRYLSNIKNESIKKDEECTSTFINYCEKKKHLSFYKGANIIVSSIIYDANKN